MKTENATSEPTSAKTSAAAPTDTGPAKAPPASEAQYLDGQIADAKAAISGAMGDLKTKLGESINLAGWTREYPWITLGAAAVAGFVAASTLVPSEQQQTLKRLKAIERAVHPKPKPAASNGHEESSSSKSSLLSGLLLEVMKAIPGTLNVIAAGLASKATPTTSPPPSTDASDGSPPPGNPS